MVVFWQTWEKGFCLLTSCPSLSTFRIERMPLLVKYAYSNMGKKLYPDMPRVTWKTHEKQVQRGNRTKWSTHCGTAYWGNQTKWNTHCGTCCAEWLYYYIKKQAETQCFEWRPFVQLKWMLLQEFHRVQFLVHCYFFYTSTTSKAVVIYFRSYYMQMIRMLSIQIRAWKLCIIQYKMKWIRLWNGSMPINYQSTLLRQNL